MVRWKSKYKQYIMDMVFIRDDIYVWVYVVIRHSSNIAQLFKSLFNIIRARSIEPLLSNSNNINYSIIEVFFLVTTLKRILKKKSNKLSNTYLFILLLLADLFDLEVNLNGKVQHVLLTCSCFCWIIVHSSDILIWC